VYSERRVGNLPSPLLAENRSPTAGGVTHPKQRGAEYFLDIAAQLGLQGDIRSAGSLAVKIPNLLAGRQKILLVLSNFENGPKDARHRLASALRTFLERRRNKVRIVIRGGEELAALKYEEVDNVSLFNIAGARLWPDLTEADLHSLFEQRKPGRSLKSGEAKLILEATGAEPRLVGHCLRYRASSEDEESVDYEQIVRSYDIATPWFVPVRRKDSDSSKVKRLLKDTDIGTYATPWFADPMTRRLFWRNAFAVREINGQKRIQWRSNALREAGRAILECED
jgi:hypothetical protein